MTDKENKSLPILSDENLKKLMEQIPNIPLLNIKPGQLPNFEPKPQIQQNFEIENAPGSIIGSQGINTVNNPPPSEPKSKSRIEIICEKNKGLLVLIGILIGLIALRYTIID